VTKEEPLGRVVMLVDNGVEGDSRVQKSARSMATAGWDVTLVGVTEPGALRTSWRLGDAEVVLVPMRRPLWTPRGKLGWSPRRPLAYSTAALAASRRQTLAARASDVRFRLATLAAARQAGGSPWAERMGKAGLLPLRVANKITNRWVRLRSGELRRVTAARANPDGLISRTQIKFWRTLRGNRSWRRLDPSFWDYELAMGKTVDDLEPDILHAHDYKALGVAARAKVRAAARGRDVKLIYDAHEYVPGLSPYRGRPGWLPAQIDYEREYAPYADAVVTVSPALAELLRDEHHLPTLPAVVMNCPTRGEAQTDRDTPGRDLRADCGIGPDTPLIAYCGGLSTARNTILTIEALPDLPDVHLALICVHPDRGRQVPDQHLARAAELGVADRTHVLNYVPHELVVSYISSADLAVSPLLHLPNHEIALSNKFFEYAQARLPMVVSDVRTMSETVRENGIGEVFPAGDRDGYVEAVRAVLSNNGKYRAGYDEPGLLDGWTWDRQATVLDAIYQSLRAPRPADATSRSFAS
jgi:glycogen synthase